MDKLFRLSSTEARLVDIVKRKRRWVDDFEVTREFRILYPDNFQKESTLERRLRELRSFGRLDGGKYTRKTKNGKIPATRYKVAA